MLEEVKAAAECKKTEKSLKKAAKAKREAEADLGKPKKPPSAFLLFSMEQQSKRAGGSILDGSKAAGERWKAMTEEDKAAYLKRNEEALTQYKT